MILTTRSLYFQHAKASETGLISFYELISTIFKCQYSRLKPKVIHNRNYKNFNDTTLECLIDAPLLINFLIFWTFLFQQFPTKQEPLLPFGNILWDCRKTCSIEYLETKYKRSWFRSIYWKNLSQENERLYKKQRNKHVFLRKKYIKQYFYRNNAKRNCLKGNIVEFCQAFF